MLIRDQEILEGEFPGAAAHLRAARLRQEAYRLARRAVGQPLTPWEATRLRELLTTPACQEPWFVDLLDHDTRAKDTTTT